MIPLVLATLLAQFCPSYSASSPEGMSANCAVNAANGTNPTVSQWQGIFALVSGGPSSWGTSGPSSVGNIGQGCGKPMATVQVTPKFPCELLKAIAMQESSWKQFCVPTTPSSQVGGASRTIISFDCGYGIPAVPRVAPQAARPAATSLPLAEPSRPSRSAAAAAAPATASPCSRCSC